MLALMLAEGSPLDLVNGQKIDVDKSLAWSNDKEYHHFFPQAYLAREGVTRDAPYRTFPPPPDSCPHS